MVSDLFHSPHRRSFHLSLTVLVHYRFLLVFSLTPWSAQIPTEFLVLRGTQVPIRSLFGFAYKTFTFYGGPFPGPFATKKFCNSSPLKVVGSYNPRASSGLGYSPFVRHYLGNRMFLYFPPLTEMFQFRKFPPHRLCIRRWVPDKSGGLPHSEISGLSLVVSYPKLIADYHVLHRPREPRHPPNALL